MYSWGFIHWKDRWNEKGEEGFNYDLKVAMILGTPGSAIHLTTSLL